MRTPAQSHSPFHLAAGVLSGLLALSATGHSATLTAIDWQSTPTFDSGTGRYTLLGTFGTSGVTATLIWDAWTGATRDLTVTEPYTVWNGRDYAEYPSSLGGPPARYDYRTATADGVNFTASGGSPTLAAREFNLTFSNPVDDLAILVNTESDATLTTGYFSKTGYGYTHYNEGSIEPDAVVYYGTVPGPSGYFEAGGSANSLNESWFMEFSDDQLSGVDFAFDLVGPSNPIHFQLFAVVPEPSGALLLGLTGCFGILRRRRGV